MINLRIVYLCALLTAVLCAFSHAQPPFIGVNCGHPSDYTSPQGDFFHADRNYSAASGFGYTSLDAVVIGPDRPIDGDQGMDSLYFYRREGEFTYHFDVPNGNYALNLFLCEKTFHWSGIRSIYACVEGDTVVDDLDIFEVADHEYALMLHFLVYCDDGQINVEMLPSPASNRATLSAVSVRAITPDSSPPETVQDFEIIDGYEMNILYWMWNSENDLAGYNVYRRESGGSWELLMPDIHSLTRYFDYDTESGIEYEYKITAEDLWGNVSGPSDSLSSVPNPHNFTTLPRYEIQISDSCLHQLNLNIWSDEYVIADLLMEGEFFPDSEIRYRGSCVRGFPKKSYRFRLPEGMTHHDWRRFNINSQYEPTMISERISYATFDSLNCLNSVSRLIHLERNGDFIGAYLELERVDNDFLQQRGLSTGGNLYKCESNFCELSTYEEYQIYYIKVNNELSDWYDIIDFIQWLNNSSYEQIHQEMGSRFAVDELLDIYTVYITIQDGDFPFHNYFFYFNPVNERWYFIPWDHNETFCDPLAPIDWGTQNSPASFDMWNILIDKVITDTLFRYSYCKKMERFLNDGFTVSQMQERIMAAYNDVYEDAIRDVYKVGWERPEPFLAGTDYLIDNVTVRTTFLQGELPGFTPEIDLAPYFRLNEIQSDNQTTISDQAGDYDPWIEINNISPVEIDLEGFTLHYGAQAWVLPPEAVIDDYNFLIFWLDGEPGEGPFHSTFALANEPGMLSLQSPEGTLSDSVSFPGLEADQVWARIEDGLGEWTGGLPPTPGSTNDPVDDPSLLVVNEFLALNDNVNPDPAGDYDDWLEIYNPSENVIELGGIFLTDNLSSPTKWAFPDTSIPAQSFILIWCDDEPQQGPLHATFRLSGDGEQVGIFDRNGITPIDTLTFAAQLQDTSFGRYPDGADDWFFLIPTPEGTNGPVVSVDNDDNDSPIPNDFSLSPAYPNPFNSGTVIRFTLPKQAYVRLIIYDILGREIAVLKDEAMTPGYYSVGFDAEGLASGIYFCNITAGSFTAARKMLLLK
ncbi:MAG: CotH kinase family protein [candidate division Zixibacteria bacterium]|nr:CotH kinase family protein [Candidatus Tariuqbacter arcticus]